MLNFGIELEFFCRKNDEFVPAFEYTNNLDGNPVLGELRTSVHNNIIDCVFDIENKLYREKHLLLQKGIELCLIDLIKVDNNFLRRLRGNRRAVDLKEQDILVEKSIYFKKLGNILPRNIFKASCQINISENITYTDYIYEKVSINNEYRYDAKPVDKTQSECFDYFSIIKSLDDSFKEEIQDTGRTKGVYSIKNGIFGKRVEYRSLPNTINLKKLLEVSF